MNAATIAIYLVGAEDPTEGLWPYLREIMAVEGLPQPSLLKREDFTRLLLPPGATVIVPSIALTADSIDILMAHLQVGGGLLALKPCPPLAAALGLRSAAGIPEFLLRDSYIELEHRHPLMAAVPRDIGYLQYHGEADPYESPESFSIAARLYWGGTSTSHGAVLTGQLGRGHLVVFAYDLATSTMLFRQGRCSQANLGLIADRSGDGMLTPNDLFVGFLDAELRLIPQADLHTRLFAEALAWLCAEQAPLPRFWYFPRNAPAIALINGDSDAMTRAEMELYIGKVQEAGGHYSTYLMLDHYDMVPPQMVQHYRRLGHDFGPHIWPGPRPSAQEFASCVQREVEAFSKRYGFHPTTTRHHCVIWPGWVEPARALAAMGIRMEVNFRAAQFFREGYLTGSGQPIQYVDRDGELIAVLQQPTLLCDDFLFQNKSYLRPLKLEEVVALTERMLADCAERYHTVFQAYFHPVYARQKPPLVPGTYTVPWLERTLRQCQELGVRMLSVREWCDFSWARRHMRFQNISIAQGQLQAKVDSAEGAIPDGLTVIVPRRWGALAASAVRVDGAPVPLELRNWLGQRWLSFELSGCGKACEFEVDYGWPK